MKWIAYYVLMYAMVLGIRISSLWNPKSALWIAGRKHWKKRLEELPSKQSVRIWFHVSSLGEFEQARPVIEALAASPDNPEIILSFFSPSGYEIRQHYSLAKVLYLPADLPGNAAYWVRRLNPDLAVFVKYDLWPGYLNALVKAEKPFLLISALLQPGQGMSSWSNPLTKQLLKKADMIFTQQDAHLDALRQMGFNHLCMAGDTRIDRVIKLPHEADQMIPDHLKKSGSFDLIAGSTWPEDEHILIPVILQMGLKTIFAPHDVRKENIDRLVKAIGVPVTRLTELAHSALKTKILVVDSIGLLAYLYAIGKIAYVGGGFGKGIHNILEPMAHNKPVLFGPKYEKFPEAIGIIQNGGGWCVQNEIELTVRLKELIQDADNVAGRHAGRYIEQHRGATSVITAYIKESIPFGTKR